MDVERNHQSFWKGKWRKYWMLHWSQPVVCKVFPSRCCSWSGNGWALPWGRHCWGSSLTLSTVSVCFPWLTSLGSFPGCQDWELYILFAFIVQLGFTSTTRQNWGCASELGKYFKIKSISASGFWAGKSRQHWGAAFQGLSLVTNQRVQTHRLFGLFWECLSQLTEGALPVPPQNVQCSPRDVGGEIPTNRIPRMLHPCPGVSARDAPDAGWATNMLLKITFKSHSYCLLYPNK